MDLWPRDAATGCWADMTRTFLIGGAPDEVVAWSEVVREALEQARGRRRGPACTGRELHAITL